MFEFKYVSNNYPIDILVLFYKRKPINMNIQKSANILCKEKKSVIFTSVVDI